VRALSAPRRDGPGQGWVANIDWHALSSDAAEGAQALQECCCPGLCPGAVCWPARQFSIGPAPRGLDLLMLFCQGEMEEAVCGCAGEGIGVVQEFFIGVSHRREQHGGQHREESRL
jgi:hypothetical protein